RAVADRRPAGPPDPRRGQGPDGHCRNDGRAVAALRRRRVFANDRDRARGRLERRLSPLPLRARRHRGALTAVLPDSPDGALLRQRDPRGSRGDAAPALSLAGASIEAFGPPLATATSAGRKTRSPIMYPGCITCATVPAGREASGSSNIA